MVLAWTVGILMSTPIARIRQAALVAPVAPMEIDLAKRLAIDASAKFWAFSSRAGAGIHEIADALRGRPQDGYDCAVERQDIEADGNARVVQGDWTGTVRSHLRGVRRGATESRKI
jgi:hypothetical protein